MRVFLSSTSIDLEQFRLAAADVVRKAQAEPIGMEDFPADPRPVVDLCRATVRSCDLVLLFVAFRRGWVPKPDEGGDGQKSITAYEIEAADLAPRIPVLCFLAEGSWPGELWDDDPVSRAWVKNFRAELNRNAKFFEAEKDPGLPIFKSLIREALANSRSGYGVSPAKKILDLRLRRIAELPLPAEPYPLLGPYEHAATFGGRDVEVNRLASLVQMPQLILSLHAASGAGKTSLLLAGLAPRLRAEEFLVSVERSPGDAGLAQRLIRDLFDDSDAILLGDADSDLPERFADLAASAQELSRKKVVLILDQLDDVLRKGEGKKESLARIGLLLAATAQRRPGGQGFAVKWLLCYRHEFHGEVRSWLEDVLSEARQLFTAIDFEALPHELSTPQKSHEWPVPVIGQPAPGERSAETSKKAFLEAIQKPAELMADGKLLFGFVIPAEGADRLATAFARERVKQPEAPLVPELQVVLGYLLAPALARQVAIQSGIPLQVEIPAESKLEEEIRDALARHLERALDSLFPVGRDAAQARLGRTRAVLALRHLADTEGRRGEGLERGELVARLGPGGETILDQLGSAEARLVIEVDGRCALSHDRLAEVVTNLVRNEATRGNLLFDQELIDLQRKIGQKEALFSSDPTDVSALLLTRRERRLIGTNESTLISDGGRKIWWRAHRAQMRHQRRIIWTAAASFLLLASLLYWSFPSQILTSTTTSSQKNANWTIVGNRAFTSFERWGFAVWDLNLSLNSLAKFRVECITYAIGIADVGCVRPDGRIHIWPLSEKIDLEDGVRATFDPTSVSLVNFPQLILSSTERIAAFSLPGEGIYLWDGRKDLHSRPELLYGIPEQQGDESIYSFELTPLGHWLKVYTRQGNILISTSKSGKRVTKLRSFHALSKDEKYVLLESNQASKNLGQGAFELVHESLDRPVRLEYSSEFFYFYPSPLSFSADNRWLIGIFHNTLLVWNLEVLSESLIAIERQEFFEGTTIDSIWIDPKSEWVAARSDFVPNLYLWKLAASQSIKVDPLFSSYGLSQINFSFSPTGRRAVSSGPGGAVFSWQPGSNPFERGPVSHQKNPHYRFSPDGSNLLSVDSRTVYWGTVEGPLQKIETTESEIQAVVVEPNRRGLAIFTKDQIIVASRCRPIWGTCFDLHWPDFGEPLVIKAQE